MDDGDRSDDRAPTSLPTTWQVLLDAQVRLEGERASLRASAIGAFVAVVLGSVLVRRFVFITEPERWLLLAAPAAVMGAAGILDHFVLGARVRRLASLAHRLEPEDRSTSARVRRDAIDPPRSGIHLLGFYGLPAVLAVALAVWGLT